MSDPPPRAPNRHLRAHLSGAWRPADADGQPQWCGACSLSSGCRNCWYQLRGFLSSRRLAINRRPLDLSTWRASAIWLVSCPNTFDSGSGSRGAWASWNGAADCDQIWWPVYLLSRRTWPTVCYVSAPSGCSAEIHNLSRRFCHPSSAGAASFAGRLSLSLWRGQ